MGDEERRVVVLFEKHIGFGIRWDANSWMTYPVHLSIAIPFVTFDIGLGKKVVRSNGI